MVSITGTPQNDDLFGAALADTLSGLGGTDTLTGHAGDDLLLGGTGNDVLIGGGGTDTIDGGSGNDEVLYYRETGTSGVSVDLLAGTATDTHGTTDTLISIEYVYGSIYNDTLLGSNIDGDRLFGWDGDDIIDGRDGNNLIYTGSGNDLVRVGTTLAGARDTVVIDGNGTKTITGTGSAGTDYGHHIVFEVDAAVTVNLATGYASSANMTVDFTGALFFLEVGGSAYDDHLTGGNAAQDDLEWYVGNQGNDVINGGSGTGDTIVYDDEVIYGQFNYTTGVHEYGTHGATVNLATGVAIDTFGFTDTLINIDQVRATRFVDTITGSNEDNGFWGLAGADTIDGGAGFDRVHYGEDYLTGGTSGINANLVTGQVVDGFGDIDTLISIESVHGTHYDDVMLGNAGINRLEGYQGNDSIDGGGGNDVLLGQEGNDTIAGGAGDDEISGGAGTDTLDGGLGIDLVRYLDSTAGVVVDLVSGAAVDGFGTTDVLLNIENAHGSGNNDTLRGNILANELFGFAGNDSLSGAAGDDTLRGGTGNDNIAGGANDDELWGDAGNDTLDGGSGIDLVRYREDLAGIVANLTTGVATDGSGSTDTLISIENLHGSDFSDRITGDALANRLFGFAGADSINGGGGNDVLLGGNGADTITGGDGDDEIWGETGDDTLDGGLGNDLARYVNDASGIIANLAIGSATDGSGATDTLISIENIHGSAFYDLITGDAQANRLYGFDGADTISGAGGNDVLLGGNGADRIFGGDGDDEIWGEAGDDTLDGGLGNDTARYLNAVQGVEVDLETGMARDGHNTTDVLISIENVHGSNFNDILNGDNNANRLFGFDGADTLVGGGGNDTLVGGNGSDTYIIESGGGYDIINDLGQATVGTDKVVITGYLAENARIYSQNANIVIDFGVSGDVVVLAFSLDAGNASAIESVQFGDGLIWDHATLVANIGQSAIAASLTPTSGADAISGTQTADSIDALAGNDLLSGLAGDDTLSGGAGNDTIHGGSGDDVINGGSGNDSLYGENGADQFVLANGMGQDRILDFELGIDTLGTASLSAAERAAITLSASASGEQMVTLADGSSVVLAGITSGSVPTGEATITGIACQNETLQAQLVGTTLFGDPLGTPVFQWFRDGTAIAGATGTTYSLNQIDVNTHITVEAQYTNAQGNLITLNSTPTDAITNTPDPVIGQPLVTGTAQVGTALTVDTSDISDADGLGSFSYQWLRDGSQINDATNASYTPVDADLGTVLSVQVSYVDGYGTLESTTSPVTTTVITGVTTFNGTAGDDILQSGIGQAVLFGYEGNDRLTGSTNDDSLYGGDGSDILIGGAGNDVIIGGDTTADLRDVAYGGDGDDSIDGGYGNDELRGDAGNDNIAGGFGADTVIGGTGNDVLTGSAYGDVIFGGDGFDFINGGFGHDRVNGGTGADRFYHLGIFDHGSDWIQDYNAADGDVLVFGNAAATAADFQINLAHTADGAGVRSGDANVQEAFVIYRPTGQIMWALVDGAGQSEINIQIGGVVTDLLA